jgi:hypothetical protein
MLGLPSGQRLPTSNPASAHTPISPQIASTVVLPFA